MHMHAYISLEILSPNIYGNLSNLSLFKNGRETLYKTGGTGWRNTHAENPGIGLSIKRSMHRSVLASFTHS